MNSAPANQKFVVDQFHLNSPQDEADEEIEEDDNYLDLAGMKQQSQMNVNPIYFYRVQVFPH